MVTINVNYKGRGKPALFGIYDGTYDDFSILFFVHVSENGLRFAFLNA